MNENVIRKISDSLEKGYIYSDRAVLQCYSDDFTEEDPCEPGAVVIPADLSELQRIVQIAGSHSIPLVPRCAGSNIGGLCIPMEDSLVVDLSLLNDIVYINEEDMIAVIEPGVTWMKLSQELQSLHPPLTFAYPLAPLHSSVMAGCILDGLGSLSLRHGTMSEMIGGMEVILPDGTTIQTGMAALFKDQPARWLSRAPLPDLSGLFIGWQGTTGIVTKISIQTWKMPPERKRYFILFGKIEDGFNLVSRLSCRFGLCDDLAGITWPASRFLFRSYDNVLKDDAEAEFLAYADIGGFSEEELAWKKSELIRAVERQKEKTDALISMIDIEDLIKLAPSLGVFARQPTTLSFLISHSMGGMTWVGAYGPLSRATQTTRSVMDVMAKFDIPPTLVARPMKGGHFAVLRFLTIFDKKNRNERKKIRSMHEEIADVLLSFGYVPYKTPPWAWKKMLGKMDRGTVDIMKTIRGAIDVNGNMNRGKLPL